MSSEKIKKADKQSEIGALIYFAVIQPVCH